MNCPNYQGVAERRYGMRHIIKGTLIVLALSGIPMIASAPAQAAVDFSVTLGNSAFGYSDGYWDRDRRFHRWRNRDEAEYFRNTYGQHYYAYRHDRDRRDRDKGWRNERWWEDRDNRR